MKSVSSSGKSMFIDFKKQYHYNLQAILNELEVSIKYNKRMSACQTWLNVHTDILKSPNPVNSMNCSWLITSNFGSYIILNFTFIEVYTKFWILSNIWKLKLIIILLLIIAQWWIWIYQNLWRRKWICRTCKKFHWDSQKN